MDTLLLRSCSLSGLGVYDGMCVHVRVDQRGEGSALSADILVY